MSIRELLDPTNSALIFIDHQPQMSFGVANIDRQTLKNNTVLIINLTINAAACQLRFPLFRRAVFVV